jgi:hypothetical protein
LPFSDPRLDVLVPPIAVLNLSHDCGLVRFTTELGPFDSHRFGDSANFELQVDARRFTGPQYEAALDAFLEIIASLQMSTPHPAAAAA